MTNAETAALIEKCGLRATQQRIAVYNYLYQNRIHPTAEHIYECLAEDYPSFSRTTVYNSLHAMEEAGLIRSLSIDAAEQRFDADFSDHGHFKCSSCGEIFDFSLPEDAAQKLCPSGFTPRITDVYILGLCSNCRNAE